ncbi:hypothetical protein B0T16DRAFT_491416 [Cercophora newfieldiana]|uniref:Protein kinase domain-containing protein n=1 Tax=Cercophora newfieldiana TaxID=92897 RepID=A0AA40CRK6_9PEZI|nr:hypothetical protein B0T16DRAFT_491416 [Cercophora newfieldiana]
MGTQQAMSSPIPPDECNRATVTLVPTRVPDTCAPNHQLYAVPEIRVDNDELKESSSDASHQQPQDANAAGTPPLENSLQSTPETKSTPRRTSLDLDSDTGSDSSTSSSLASLFGPGDGISSPAKITFGADGVEEFDHREGAIVESNDELVDQRLATTPTPIGRRRYPPSVDSVARAAFNRDDGPLPALHRELFRPRIPEESSEITDFGGELHYNDRKSRRRRSKRPKSTGTKSLQIRLFEALEPTDDKTKDKGFFPLDLLPVLLTEQSVSEELERHLRDTCEPDEIAKCVRTICSEKRVDSFEDGAKPRTKTYRKIFATLVLIEKTPAIRKFIREGLTDLDLPLVRSTTGIGMRRSRVPGKELKCFQSGWSPFQIRNFEDWQWTTLAPFFAKGEQRKDVHHYLLQDRVILPFLHDRKPEGVDPELLGGGGRVFKAGIHPDHHNFHAFFGCPRSTPSEDSDEIPECACAFAIKCLHSQDRASFKKEVDMLKRFSNNMHPHLISLLATYEQKKTFYLIFPCAEDDLQSYWKKTTPPSQTDIDGVCWVAEQCLGIAKGVLKIHEYESSNSRLHPNMDRVVGHHGDIKPENVLWFRDTEGENQSSRGTLKLSDFGLADLTSSRTASRRFHSRMAVTCNYRAPECDLHNQGGKGRQYDMWTLGCLYLEFVTWLVGGNSLLEDFSKARLSVDPSWFNIETDSFFELRKEAGTAKEYAVVKKSVTKFIERLLADARCTPFVRDFLDLIQKGLLVVKNPNPRLNDRLSIEQTHAKLTAMVFKCKTEQGYACKLLEAVVASTQQESEGTFCKLPQ